VRLSFQWVRFWSGYRKVYRDLLRRGSLNIPFVARGFRDEWDCRTFRFALQSRAGRMQTLHRRRCRTAFRLHRNNRFLAGKNRLDSRLRQFGPSKRALCDASEEIGHQVTISIYCRRLAGLRDRTSASPQP